MSRKICLLRSPAEIEALSHLRKLQNQIKLGQITEEQARKLFAPHASNMPDCEHHVHLTRREARKRETQGRLHFLAGWDEWYAQDSQPNLEELPRAWMPRMSGGMSVMQLVEC